MFTGIVEHVGTILEYIEVDSSATGGNGVSIVIGDAEKILGDVHIGDSISINGTCLTVTEFTKDTFKVGLIPETLRRTNLGTLKPGKKANLERAVAGDVRFGGHYVQGHVDTVAEILGYVKDDNALDYTFKIKDLDYIQYIVEKGFIAIDGVSLTVTHVDHTKGTFGVSLISHTQENIVLPLKATGEFVNIEVDLTGKVIAQQVEIQLANQIGDANSTLVKLIESIIEKKLKEKQPT
jgi:riboflavin synthase